MVPSLVFSVMPKSLPKSDGDLYASKAMDAMLEIIAKRYLCAGAATSQPFSIGKSRSKHFKTLLSSGVRIGQYLVYHTRPKHQFPQIGQVFNEANAQVQPSRRKHESRRCPIESWPKSDLFVAYFRRHLFVVCVRKDVFV